MTSLIESVFRIRNILPLCLHLHLSGQGVSPMGREEAVRTWFGDAVIIRGSREYCEEMS